MGKKVFGIIFLAAGILMILGAAGLAGYNIHMENQAEKVSEQAVIQLVPQIKEESPSLENEIPEYILNPDMKMPTKEIDGNLYIGVLEIPSIGLKLPVIDSWDYDKLKIAPCRYAGSVYKNDLVIAAHNYKSHFEGIQELPEGTEIHFTDTNNNKFVFTISSTEMLQPDQNDDLVSKGDWDLTLFTCNYSGSARWTVRCIKKE